MAGQAFSRAAGAPLVAGNAVRLLKDGEENYPAWLDAIANAKSSILFESYIIHEDQVGDEFAEAFIQKAREGVRVYILYDWLGGLGKTSLWYWRNLRREGVEVRCFNRFQFTDPLWIRHSRSSQNHRCGRQDRLRNWAVHRPDVARRSEAARSNHGAIPALKYWDLQYRI